MFGQNGQSEVALKLVVEGYKQTLVSNKFRLLMVVKSVLEQQALLKAAILMLVQVNINVF